MPNQTARMLKDGRQIYWMKSIHLRKASLRRKPLFCLISKASHLRMPERASLTNSCARCSRKASQSCRVKATLQSRCVLPTRTSHSRRNLCSRAKVTVCRLSRFTMAAPRSRSHQTRKTRLWKGWVLWGSRVAWPLKRTYRLTRGSPKTRSAQTSLKEQTCSERQLHSMRKSSKASRRPISEVVRSSKRCVFLKRQRALRSKWKICRSHLSHQHLKVKIARQLNLILR